MLTNCCVPWLHESTHCYLTGPSLKMFYQKSYNTKLEHTQLNLAIKNNVDSQWSVTLYRAYKASSEFLAGLCTC